MWLAILTKLGTEVQTVTTELNSTFLSSAKEEDVIGHATVLKLGKTQIFGTAECRTNSGKLLTYHTISYARIAE
jgi:acyl-coenzyme A thioesterase PaaI-like protein